MSVRAEPSISSIFTARWEGSWCVDTSVSLPPSFNFTHFYSLESVSISAAIYFSPEGEGTVQAMLRCYTTVLSAGLLKLFYNCIKKKLLKYFMAAHDYQNLTKENTGNCRARLLCNDANNKSCRAFCLPPPNMSSMDQRISCSEAMESQLQPLNFWIHAQQKLSEGTSLKYQELAVDSSWNGSHTHKHTLAWVQLVLKQESHTTKSL